MYQPATAQHFARNQMSTQLDLNSLQTVNSTNQSTQFAHHLDHHSTHHLDQLHHSIHHPVTSSSFSLNIAQHHPQPTGHHLFDQSNSIHSLNNQFNENRLHDSSLNAPELSYDFSRLINSNNLNSSLNNNLNRSKRKFNSTDDDLSINNLINSEKTNHDNQTKSSQLNQSSQIFDSLTKKVTNSNSSKNDTINKNDLRRLTEQRTNPQLCLNQQSNNLMNTNSFLVNNGQCSPNSPNSVAGSEFNQTENRLNNNGLLTVAPSITNTLNEQSNVSRNQQSVTNTISVNNLNNLMTNTGNSDKTSTPILNLINSTNLQQSYSSQTANSLKLHIKTEPEPDEQQRDFTSACTSDNSIYSPALSSNNTELTGYHSPTAHNLLFSHVLNGKTN